MKTLVVDKVEKRAGKSQPTFPDQMEAIACGVQARFEEDYGCPRKLIKTTVEVAQALGVPRAVIDRWLASRLTQITSDTEKLREIKSLLERLEQSPV